MDILQQFKEYLEAGGTSKSTIKNYRADIGQFILWYEVTFQLPFDPARVNQTTLQAYRKHRSTNTKISERTLQRHFSSIRKLFAFLNDNGYSLANDVLENKQATDNQDPWNLKEFKEFLYINNSSPLTIKNYLMDVRQFLSWVEKVVVSKEEWDKSKSIFDVIDSSILGEYKSRLLTSGFSPSSINRKLSSIRRYFDYRNIPSFTTTSLSKAPLFDREAFLNMHQEQLSSKPANIKKGYSSFPPIRLFQKVSALGGLTFDKAFIIPASLVLSKAMDTVWSMKGKPLFDTKYQNVGNIAPITVTVTNVPKELFAPHKLSTIHFPIHKKVIFTLHHKRPNWYKSYHSNGFTSYLHLGILFIFCALDVLLLYHKFQTTGPSTQILGEKASAYTRSMVFKARLTDRNNIPILSPSDIRVGLYNDPAASGSALLWEDVLYHVIPNSDGTFTISLGSDKNLSQDLFSSNYQLYLGISIGSNPELTPRQELPTTDLASSAQSLAGLKPITQPNAGYSNVVLALNSSGDLSMGGANHHVFQASGGEFKLSGQPLTLATNPGTSGDVVVTPDGNGMLDIQKPIHNTSNNNSAPNAIGSVEVDDLFSILATSAADSAFTVDQNGTGNFISGYNNSIAKFSVGSSGNAFFAGNVGIGTEFPLQSLDVKGNIMLSNTSPTLYLGPKNYVGFDTANLNIYSTTGDIVAHPATSSSFRPFYDDRYSLGNASYRWNSLAVGNGTSSFGGKIGIGTANPSSTLQIQRDSGGNAALAILEQGSGDLLVASSSSGSKFVISNSGFVGIGTASPSSYFSAIGNKSEGDGAIARVTNLNTTDDTNNTALSIRLGTSFNSQNARFVQFLTDATSDSTGNGAGRIRSNGNLGGGAVAYESGAADFAEYFDKGEYLTSGDIVQLNGNNQVVRATQRDGILGVVSATGAFIGNLPKEGQESNKVIVGLLGQLPVKVSTENGAIAVNDLISLSQIAGIGSKAQGAGRIIGRAMESFDGQNAGSCEYDPSYRCGQIKVLINPSWSNPSVYLTDTGNLNIVKNSQTQDFGFGNWKLEIGNSDEFIHQIGAFENAVIANLTAGAITTKDLISDTITGNVKITSPLAEIDTIHTNIISPKAIDSHIALKFGPNRLVITNDSTGSGSAVATIDNAGNASFSGQLASNSLTTNDATISGVLHANKIYADEIIGSFPTATYSAITTDNQLSTASLSAVTADVGQFNQGLMVLGPTSVTDITVANQLAVGTNLILSDSAISVLGGTLSLQPFKDGPLSFEGGLVAIDTEGNLTVSGNATFAKDVTVNGTLNTNVLSPIPGKDLVVNLNNSLLTVNSSSGSAMFTVDPGGNIKASGSATINKLNLSLVSPVLAVSSVEVIATGSAGMAAIKPHQVELTIKNPLVTANSLIYITPIGTPSGQTPFLERQSPSDSFTVGIEDPAFSDTTFNWLIIN